MVQEMDLNGKIWYRITKVAYISIYALSILVVLLIVYSTKPYTSVDSKSSLIVCNNGKSIQAGDIGVYVYQDGTISNPDSKAVSGLCSLDPTLIDGVTPVKSEMDKMGLDEYGRDMLQADYKGEWQINYTIKPKYETIHNWGDVLSTAMIGFGIVFVVFEVIKRTFLYVVLGRNFITIKKK